MGRNRNRTFGGGAAVALLLAVWGCGGGSGGSKTPPPPPPPPANTTTVTANLTAASVVGGSTEAGTAATSLTLNLDDGTLSGTVTLTGVTATGVTINQGFAGQRGTPMVTLQQDSATSWSVPAGAVLTAADQDALKMGAVYVLVSTAAQPDGALRAQLLMGNVSVVFVDLSDTQEVPLLTSSATAVGAVTLDHDSGALVVNVNTTSLDDAVAAHVHQGPAGVNGAILIGLNQDPSDVKHWQSDGAVLDAAGLQAFDAAQLYINVHTPANPGGEIRGQIVPPNKAVLFVPLSGSEEVPPVVINARATAAITYDPSFAAGDIEVHINTLGLDDSVAAHVHQAPKGANGPVLIGLNQDPNDVSHWQSDGAVLDAAGIAAFNAGELYVNVHTPAEPDGAVRGQIVPPSAPPASGGSFQVASITPAAGANLTSFPSQIVVTFNRNVSAASVTTASVELRASGGDGSFGDGNEMAVAPTAVSSSGATTTIDLSSVVVASDTFEVRLKGTGGETIKDANGNVLDGDSDDASGGDFVSMFGVTANTATFTSIQNNVFTPSCALSGCHAGASPQAGMNLSQRQAYAAIVGVPSNEQPSLMRVNPGNPDQSYLVQKIEGTAVVGGRMPLGGPPLSNDLIQMIRQWVANGAQDDTASPGTTNPGTTTPGGPGY